MPTCSTDSLNLACFRGSVLSRLQKKAFKIWYMTNELKALGGTDYTASLTSTLLTDTNSLFEKWDRDALDSARVAIDYNNAVTAGASVSAVPNTVQPSVARLERVNEDMLDKMETFLMCQLGVHATQ